MGAWGVAVFSDDLAADLRGEFRDLIGDGLTSTEAVNKLVAEYKSSLEDSDEASVFWIALASIQWKLGRLEERTKKNALHVIDTGQDLERWDLPDERKKRSAVLAKVRKELLSPVPAPKRVPRNIKEANDWSVGDVVGLRLLSGKWTLMRVVGHHADKGGRFAVCELLDWVGNEPFPKEAIGKMSVRRSQGAYDISQFLFQEPRKKKDKARVLRLGVVSKPGQKCGGFTALPWQFVDRQLKELFGLV
jgi:hypothetical protein